MLGCFGVVLWLSCGFDNFRSSSYYPGFGQELISICLIVLFTTKPSVMARESANWYSLGSTPVLSTCEGGESVKVFPKFQSFIFVIMPPALLLCAYLCQWKCAPRITVRCARMPLHKSPLPSNCQTKPRGNARQI